MTAVIQHLVLVNGLWECAACGGRINDGELTHAQDCSEMAVIMAMGSGRLHFRLAGSAWSQCGHGGGETNAPLTDDPRQVTCRGCLKSTDPAMVLERKRRRGGQP